jgi:ribosome-associated heat shock protein Hsp15
VLKPIRAARAASTRVPSARRTSAAVSRCLKLALTCGFYPGNTQKPIPARSDRANGPAQDPSNPHNDRPQAGQTIQQLTLTATSLRPLTPRGFLRHSLLRVKPSKDVRFSDTVEVRIGDVQKTVAVSGVADKRGSATVAAMLYEETPESITNREQRALERRLARPLGAELGARPTKQARRRIEALRRSQQSGRLKRG